MTGKAYPFADTGKHGAMEKPESESHYFGLEDYRVFQEFLRRVCGIVLGDSKQYLVANRLRHILREEQAPDLQTLVQRINGSGGRALRERVIDAMTTNETFWFRDNFPFEALHDTLLPRLLREERRDPLRVWSAACSSGQEPYSISMIIEEFRGRNPGVVRSEPVITATDISSVALDSARRACYDQLSVNRGLDEHRRRQFFRRTEEGLFQVDPAITRRVSFRQMNLQDSFAGLGRFDIIFCRNVLIYFAADLKADILHRMHAAMNPGSYLVLGASEAMPGKLEHLFTSERVNSRITLYKR